MQLGGVAKDILQGLQEEYFLVEYIVNTVNLQSIAYCSNEELQ